MKFTVSAIISITGAGHGSASGRTARSAQGPLPVLWEEERVATLLSATLQQLSKAG